MFIATYGPTKTFEYTSVAGLRLSTGLLSPGGVKKYFGVSLLLQSRIDTDLKDLPSFDKRLAGGDVWTEDLTISTGGKKPEVEYTFPAIEFEGISSFYTNAQQYHLLHFTYRAGLTPGPGKGNEIPDIKIHNRSKPTIHADRARSKGSLALNADGANEAPLLALHACQVKENASVIQMVTERCSHAKDGADTGWLNQILAQNRVLNEASGPVTLAFRLNGETYRCDPPENDDPKKCGLSYLHWEERHGLALALPLPSVQHLGGLAAPPVARPGIEQLVPALTASAVLADLDDGDARLAFNDRTVEVCSIVSGSAQARKFDWRSPRQRPAS